jgi:hypothetical protein
MSRKIFTEISALSSMEYLWANKNAINKISTENKI